MLQFFNFVMSALNDPMAAGQQMALEGISPDMLGSAMKPESQQTLGMMMNPRMMDHQVQQQQMQTPQSPQVQEAVYRPSESAAQVVQTGGAGGSSSELMQRFQQSLMRGDPDRGVRGLRNPNAIAAVMSTGKHESAFNPTNVYGTWSDPSEKGEAGTAGGALSWRAGRLSNLMNYGGGKIPEIEKQAQFFLEENPQVIARLEASESPEEAQQVMNDAWRFAGYDKPGGEAAERMATARLFSGRPMGEIDEIVPNVSTGTETTDDGTFTMEDVAGDTSSEMPAAPMTKAQKLAQKIAQIGKGVKTPERQPVESPKIVGGLTPQVGGAYQPGDIGKMFALLGGGGSQAQLPPLSQLIRGGR